MTTNTVTPHITATDALTAARHEYHNAGQRFARQITIAAFAALRSALPGADELLVDRAHDERGNTMITLLGVFAAENRVLWLADDCDSQHDYGTRRASFSALDSAVITGVQNVLLEAADQPNPGVFRRPGHHEAWFVHNDNIRNLLFIRDPQPPSSVQVPTPPEMTGPMTEHVAVLAADVLHLMREDADAGLLPYTVTTFEAASQFRAMHQYLSKVCRPRRMPFPTGWTAMTALRNEITRRLQAGELTGGGWTDVRWNTTVQHQALLPNVQAWKLLGTQSEPESSCAWWASLSPDEAFMARLERDDMTTPTIQDRSVDEVERVIDRELSADEVSALGMDPGGADGHLGFPYRWVSVTAEHRQVLVGLGSTAAFPFM